MTIEDLYDYGLTTNATGDSYVDDAIPIGKARRAAIMLLFNNGDGSMVTREYAQEKMLRIQASTQWWHLLQMLHPVLWSIFLAMCDMRHPDASKPDGVQALPDNGMEAIPFDGPVPDETEDELL